MAPATVAIPLLGLGLAAAASLAWPAAHASFALVGFLLPALVGLHAVTLHRLAGTHWPGPVLLLAMAGPLLGALAMPAGGAWQSLGWLLVLAATMPWTLWLLGNAPKGLVRAEDRLTKGDDACMKHVVFAHRFLPLALVALVVGPWLPAPWDVRLHAAGLHLLLIGFMLLSVYGLGHFWVPRFSGVPAIAAGAIKGELHSTLLGVVGVVAGLLAGGTGTPTGRGLLVGFGPLVFLGFFVYMGVLGANIMKNKSPTNSVRPEFVYIPWTFSGVFWLVCGVLMGIFLSVVPEQLAAQAAALGGTHAHIALFGGIAQLWLAWWTRIPAWPEGIIPRFQGPMRGAFFAYNASVALVLWHLFGGPAWTGAAALGLLALGIGGWSLAMRNSMSRPVAVPA